MRLYRERVCRRLDRTVPLFFLLPFYVWLLIAPSAEAAQPDVQSVAAIGMTVSDLDRSVEFFSKVLAFEKVSEVEVFGTEYEHLQGVFGL